MPMDFLVPSVTLDPAKPFYGLVVGYLAQLHGLIELCSRSISRQLERVPEPTRSRFDSAAPVTNAAEALKRIAAGGRTGLLGDQKLASRTSSPLEVDIQRLSDALVADYPTVLEHLNEVAAGGVLIVAWAITERFYSTTPVWEFLRHCRNAAAHRGHFHFLKSEPRRPARWRDLEVTGELQGVRLLRNPHEPGFLSPGDVIYLLADIEVSYPEINWEAQSAHAV